MDLPSTWDDLRKQLQASQTWALRNWCKCCTWAIPPEKHIFSHVANWKLPWVRPTWQARKLEGQLDEQLTSYRRVANTKGEGSEQDHEAGIERLLQQLQHVNTQMQVWVASESSDILSHTLTRHREIFHDLSQEFNRLRSSLRARREHTALLENFSKFDHASSDLERNTDSAEQALLKEQATLQRSTVQKESRGVCSGNRAGSGFEPGTGSVSSEMGRRLKMNELVLRFLTVGLAVVSAVTVGTDSQTKYIFDLPKKANFRLIRALVFLVVVDAVVAGYSLIQGFRCISSMHVGSILLSRPLAWLIFTFDQAMTYITLAAAASAAEASYLAKIGESEFQWMKACNLYGMFCTRIGVGFVSAFVADLCMVIVSGMSAYHLFRLYGPKCKSIP